MNAVVASVYPRWAAGVKPLLLLVGIAAAVAAGVAVVLWSRGPSYSLLYGNLAASDQAQITQALDTAGIPYQLTPDSTGIEVPSEDLNQARLKLAGQGLPEDEGFSLMTKTSGFGVSQFMENARYQHALEIELARTIASLSPVDGARVHLAETPQSAFVRDRIPASASVFVQLKPGRVLSEEQVQAVVNLIASSVPDLSANHVTVVDQQGQLLSAPQDAASAARQAHFELVHRLEDDYDQRIENLLAPLVGGNGHVRAQVVADMDTSVSEQASELYKPGSQIVRSEELSQQTSRGTGIDGGVPGALSNVPPPAGVAEPPVRATATSSSNNSSSGGGTANASTTAAQGGTGSSSHTAAAAAAARAAQPPQNTSTQSTRNYEIDRTLDYTRQPAGRIKRLTVAVLIDDVHEIGKNGKPIERPLTAAELTHITQLVKDAVGFDAARGDSVNVVNSSFEAVAQPDDTSLERVPFWQQPLFMELAKLAAGLVVLTVLALAVLRPLVRALIGPARAQALRPPGGPE
ncbi:MAG: flagellar basal-body MS-ring/collar protein FliF, partial [Steroidobacteraceae bacterium]